VFASLWPWLELTKKMHTISTIVMWCCQDIKEAMMITEVGDKWRTFMASPYGPCWPQDYRRRRWIILYTCWCCIICCCLSYLLLFTCSACRGQEVRLPCMVHWHARATFQRNASPWRSAPTIVSLWTISTAKVARLIVSVLLLVRNNVVLYLLHSSCLVTLICFTFM